MIVHVANDRPTALHATLRILLLSRGEQNVGEARAAVAVPAHGHGEWNVEELLGRFVDASWAYRFGPPAQDAILLTLTGEDGDSAHAVHFPAARPLDRESPESLGLCGRSSALPGGELELTLQCARLAYGVRIHSPGYRPQDDCLTLEPGAERRIVLRPAAAAVTTERVWLTALNMAGHVDVEGTRQ